MHKIPSFINKLRHGGVQMISPCDVYAEKDVPPHALAIVRGPVEVIKRDYVTRDEDGWHFRNKYMQKPLA